MSYLRSHCQRRTALVLLLPATILAVVALASSLSVRPGAAYEPWWVQSHRETQLWSGPDSQAISFGLVPPWSHFLVVAPQAGPRLYVQDPRNGDYAYLDAADVGPSSAPPVAISAVRGEAPSPPVRQPPKLPPGYKPWWVANFLKTELWSASDDGAPSLGSVPQFRRFLAVEPQNGNRLRVWSPEKDIFGFLDAKVVGPSGPSVWMEARPARPLRQVGMTGRAVGDKTYTRNLPIRDDETEVRRIPSNSVVAVREAVAANDGTQWYTVGSSQYLLATEVRLPRPVEKTMPGRWIDADLAEPAMVTAYEGNRIVYSALAIKGYAATPTLRGTFQILRRVEKETMDSETIGIPRDAPGGYLLKDVLYTQYFTNDGASLHYNYWLGTFGYPGSHGCLGLNLEDAKWFWDWASVGTPVVIR